MDATAMFIAGLIVLPAVGLMTCVWFAMAQIEEELRQFSGFEGMRFDNGPALASGARPGRER